MTASAVAEQARLLIKRTTTAQGLPAAITDPVVLDRVASILADRPPADRKVVPDAA